MAVNPPASAINNRGPGGDSEGCKAERWGWAEKVCAVAQGIAADSPEPDPGEGDAPKSPAATYPGRPVSRIKAAGIGFTGNFAVHLFEEN
ncbi:MAG: hypothetical protein LBF62_10360 [Tannerellaceae bacterium]|nr:hypothetical protein [Tannerellaceae bacterium]